MLNHECRPTARTFYGVVAAGAGAAGSYGFGFTATPSRTFCKPSTTTRSPGFNPFSMIHIVPLRAPTVTGRMLALSSAPTTTTW